jgi:hypothetical protein
VTPYRVAAAATAVTSEAASSGTQQLMSKRQAAVNNRKRAIILGRFQVSQTEVEVLQCSNYRLDGRRAPNRR